MNRRPASPSLPRSTPADRSARSRTRAFWGAVLLAGGLATWHSIPSREAVPEVWRETAGPGGTADLAAELRPGDSRGGELLRLEWPAHPRARSYRVRFAGTGGRPRPPIPVQGTVFLYDLRSDVLQLHRDFEWDVSAVLPDGNEVVTPTRRVTLDHEP